MLGIKTVRHQPIFTVFGNRIVQGADDQFYILATGEPYNAETHKNLVCPKCGEKPTADGHDPCIANLPSVEFACCGHGIQRGYVTFTDGRSLYGIFSHMLEQVTREELKAKSKEPGFDPYKYEVIP